MQKPAIEKLILVAEGENAWAVAVHLHREHHYRSRDLGAKLQIQDDVQS